MKNLTNICRKLIFFQIVFISIMEFLISELHFPPLISYITDLVNLALLIQMLLERNRILPKIGAKNVRNAILLFALFCALGAALRLVPPPLAIWAARNTFRGVVFFLACVRFFDAKDCKKVFDIFFVLQILNTVLSLFQYFAQGFNQDRLGGIFGTQVGCNAFTNIFFVILLTYYCAAYINNTEPLWKLIGILATTMLIAALAELKFYYIEYVMIVGLCVIFSKFSRKTIILIVSAFTMWIAGLFILNQIFPWHFEVIINPSKLRWYASMEEGGYNIGRLKAFSRINQLFFKGDVSKLLFGYGFGACEHSRFSFLTSEFYKINGDYHYAWFAHMKLFLETGYVGIILFIHIFISMFIYATKNKKKGSNDSYFLCVAIFLQVLSPVLIINLWYNHAILSEIQYFIYTGLAMFLVVYKDFSEKLDTTNDYQMNCGQNIQEEK